MYGQYFEFQLFYKTEQKIPIRFWNIIIIEIVLNIDLQFVPLKSQTNRTSRLKPRALFILFSNNNNLGHSYSSFHPPKIPPLPPSIRASSFHIRCFRRLPCLLPYKLSITVLDYYFLCQNRPILEERIFVWSIKGFVICLAEYSHRYQIINQF